MTILSASGLAGCSGGNSDPELPARGTTAPATLKADVSTGSGIDANNDGVRDDIAAILRYGYGAESRTLAHLLKLARHYQSWVGTPPLDQSAARIRLLDELVLIDCLRGSRRLGYGEARNLAAEVRTRTFNTVERFGWLRQTYEKAGAFVLPKVESKCTS